jgi:TalC/MipB family fructose-6-phosphate aldolase
MELYLDSANLKEIDEAFDLGFLYGLTTTPTFMHREGVTDLDKTIVELSKKVPVLQIEALGHTAEEIVEEAERLLALGLDKEKTVFKIPISLIGAKACRMLIDRGMKVNLHLIYTVQQSYLAMSAGATYICPLVGRLQDQGHDALGVIEQTVNAVNRFNYPSKVMFSSVRNVEHVRNALNLGVHACTIPWKILQQLPANHFTTIGTDQFWEDTRMVTSRVSDVISSAKATISNEKTVLDALVEMTRNKFGAVTIVDKNYEIQGVFTDGDLRRLIEAEGEGVLQKQLSVLPAQAPISIEGSAMLADSQRIFHEKKVDTIVVTENGTPVGMLDIQDLV